MLFIPVYWYIQKPLPNLTWFKQTTVIVTMMSCMFWGLGEEKHVSLYPLMALLYIYIYTLNVWYSIIVLFQAHEASTSKMYPRFTVEEPRAQIGDTGLEQSKAG